MRRKEKHLPAVLGVGISLLLIAVIAVVTMILRVLPFVVFPAGKETPAYIKYLGKVLPYAIMGMLVVYCFRSTKILVYPYAFPQIIAGGVVIVLHWWKKKTLLSIATGTILYMILIQNIF